MSVKETRISDGWRKQEFSSLVSVESSAVMKGQWTGLGRKEGQSSLQSTAASLENQEVRHGAGPRGTT